MTVTIFHVLLALACQRGAGRALNDHMSTKLWVAAGVICAAALHVSDALATKPAPPPPPDPALGSDGSAGSGASAGSGVPDTAPPWTHPHVEIGYGVSVGGTLAVLYDGNWTGIAGGEVSAFRMRTEGWEFVVPTWYGAYVECVRDFGAHTERFSVGPEVGAAMFGADAGVLVEIPHDGAGTRVGATLRGVLTFGYAQAYIRYNRYFDTDAGANGLEIGLLLKWPFLQKSTGWGS